MQSDRAVVCWTKIRISTDCFEWLRELSSDVCLRTRPWPWGASRTRRCGLVIGFSNEVLDLGLDDEGLRLGFWGLVLSLGLDAEVLTSLFAPMLQDNQQWHSTWMRMSCPQDYAGIHSTWYVILACSSGHLMSCGHHRHQTGSTTGISIKIAINSVV